jgi:protein-S-isoprenylcysteine O-methyltransferase Ste14
MNSTAAPNRFAWPPLIYLAAIIAGIVLTVVYPLPWITAPLSDILFAAGWLLVFSGLALNISALRTLRRANTTMRPDRPSDHLVTSGPFSFTRNPIYLGNTMLTIGIGLVTESLWFLLFALCAAFATQKLAIEGEERHLEAKFGKKYRDYRARIRRWI